MARAPARAARTRRVGRDDVDPLLADRALQLGRGAGGDLAAVVDQDDPVGERVGLLEVLRRQEQRDPVGDELADRRPHDLTAARVEAGRRLVEHEQLRRVDQAGGEVDPTALTPRQLLDQPAGELPALEALEQPRRRPRRPRGGRGRAAGPSGSGSREQSGLGRARRTGRSARSAPRTGGASRTTS